MLAGGSGGAASVVVGVERDADFLALGDVGAEVLDLVGVDVGCAELHGGGEVEDDGQFFCRAPGFFHGFTHADCVVPVGVGEALW